MGGIDGSRQLMGQKTSRKTFINNVEGVLN
jgi:hypothetical protein